MDDLEKLKDVALGQRSLEMSEGDLEVDHQASSSGYVAFAGRGHSLGVDEGARAVHKEEVHGKLSQSKKSQKFGGVCDGGGEGSDSGLEAAKGAIQGFGTAKDQVQYEESHIPSESKHPYPEMEEEMVNQGQCVEMEHSKVGAHIERGVGDGMDGGTGDEVVSVDVDCATHEDRGGSVQRDIQMDVEEQTVEISEPLTDKSPPLPMEVDSADEDMVVPESNISFSQSQAASNVGIVAELRRFNTEPVIGAMNQEVALNRVASDPSLLLQPNSPGITAELPPGSSSQGAANETNPMAGQGQSEVNSNPSNPVIGSEEKETTGVTNEETAYISRRLGPGYTVLVKREEEERT